MILTNKLDLLRRFALVLVCAAMTTLVHGQELRLTHNFRDGSTLSEVANSSNATVQCNRCSLPYLAPGKNKVTVSVGEPAALGNNTLVVTYAYRLGTRQKSYEDLAGMRN